MKRLFKLLVVVIIVMGLCGCGTKKEQVEDAYVSELNHTCQLINEK